MHFHNQNTALEVEQQERICQYGEPVLAVSLQGWWSPDEGDMHRIHALLYYEQYEYQTLGHPQLWDHPSWLLHGEDSWFRWLDESLSLSPDLATAMAVEPVGLVDPEDPAPNVPMTPGSLTRDDDIDISKTMPNSFTDKDMDGLGFISQVGHQ